MRYGTCHAATITTTTTTNNATVNLAPYTTVQLLMASDLMIKTEARIHSLG